MSSLKKEINELKNLLGELDKKIVFIFLSIAILQTISWYYGSRSFFRANYLAKYFGNPNNQIYEFVFWFISDIVLFLFIPLIIIKVVFKEKLKEYGFSIGRQNPGLKIVLISLSVMIPLLWFVSSLASFSSNYPHYSNGKLNWEMFLIYEISMICYLFAWEFIWRGYTLFGLEQKFGIYAVFIQMIPFVILHNGKPPLETFAAILGGLALGFLAIRTRSFIYGFYIHVGIMFFIDLFSVLRFRIGNYNLIF
ncbi:MAG: CPBP family intramembrane metalloprotease [Melioribacteraceae bacterium]|nr:CPBP family intramembrane metalloprotease [Melioribacteraceae bacterium]MCF8266078.1 CPBP family intramembrane metalloprotease [Melioribacteraceae bacterium]